MRKKHPIRTAITVLLLLTLVAGLTALPLLTAGSAPEENRASILSAVPERRTLVRSLLSGAPLASQGSTEVSIPSGIRLTEFLTANGQRVQPGDAIGRVDDVSVMTAVQSVQKSLDIIAGQLQKARDKIEPGVITVNEAGKLCVNGRQIPDDKLASYTDFLNLSQQHREYESLMLELFLLHQEGVVKATASGSVSGLDTSMLQPLSADGAGALRLLALNTPDGDDNEVYNGFVRLVTDFGEDGSWYVRTGTTPAIITDFLDMSGVSLAVSENVEILQPETVFAYSGGEWSVAQVQRGDILLYAFAQDNSYWVIRIGNVPITEPEEPPEEEPEDPPEEEDSVEEAQPNQPSNPTRPSGGTTIDWSQISGMFGGSGHGGGAGGNGNGSNLHSLERTNLCTITPEETMELLLPIDEMDIAELHLGMDVNISLEAIPGKQFRGAITQISQFGLNSGGSSKFTVTVELPHSAGMLPGMNANVTIPLETLENVLTIPVAALIDEGSKSLVYTAQDEKTGTLTNPVPLELGYSDGEYVQILSGIEPGISLFYSYYDVLEISTAVETRGMFR